MSFAAPTVRASITRSVSGLAWQKSALPCAFSSSVQRALLVDAVVDAALHEFALAAAAGAVPAAVRQDVALAQRGGEHRLAFLDLELHARSAGE